MYRLLRWAVLVGVAAIVISSLPDVARYLRMRAL